MKAISRPAFSAATPNSAHNPVNMSSTSGSKAWWSRKGLCGREGEGAELGKGAELEPGVSVVEVREGAALRGLLSFRADCTATAADIRLEVTEQGSEATLP